MQSLYHPTLNFVVRFNMAGNRKKSPINPSSQTLGDKTFAAITAVEGLKLSVVSKQRMTSMKARKLTPAQKRAEVLRAYSLPKTR
jgi:hypothetical protein